jgi:hypothetical protein
MLISLRNEVIRELPFERQCISPSYAIASELARPHD